MSKYEIMSSKIEFQDRTRKFVSKGVMNPGDEYVEVGDFTKDGVRCERCNKIHLLDGSDEVRFVTMIGNVHINDGGGVLGCADWDKKGVPVYHFCPKCLVEEVLEWTGCNSRNVSPPQIPTFDRDF